MTARFPTCVQLVVWVLTKKSYIVLVVAALRHQNNPTIGITPRFRVHCNPHIKLPSLSIMFSSVCTHLLLLILDTIDEASSARISGSAVWKGGRKRGVTSIDCCIHVLDGMKHEARPPRLPSALGRANRTRIPCVLLYTGPTSAQHILLCPSFSSPRTRSQGATWTALRIRPHSTLSPA